MLSKTIRNATEHNEFDLETWAHEAKKLEAIVGIQKEKIDILFGDYERLRDALTDGGKLVPYHFQTWAGALEKEQRYESRLTQWLKKVAEALEALGD